MTFYNDFEQFGCIVADSRLCISRCCRALTPPSSPPSQSNIFVRLPAPSSSILNKFLDVLIPFSIGSGLDSYSVFFIWYAFQLSQTNKLNYRRKNHLATEYCKSLRGRALTVYLLFPGIKISFRPAMIGVFQVETSVLLWCLSLRILLFANWSGDTHSLSYRQMDVFMLDQLNTEGLRVT